MSENSGVVVKRLRFVHNGEVLLTKSGLFKVEQVWVHEPADEVVLWHSQQGELRGGLEDEVTVVTDLRQLRFSFEEVN